MKKTFTYFIKFLLIPSPLFFSLYFDFFNIDFFNIKKINILQEKIVKLENITQLQTAELQKKEQQLSLNNTQNYDTQKIILYTTGILITGLACFFIYNYFNNNGDAFGLLASQASDNSKTIVQTIAKTSELNRDTFSNLSENIINSTKKLQMNNIEALGNIVNESQLNAQNNNKELVQESVKYLHENLTNINDSLNQQILNLSHYIYENVASKINRIDTKIQSVINIITNNSNENVSSANTVWDNTTGIRLGNIESGSIIVPAEIPINPVDPSFTIQPDDIIFE